MKLLVCLLIAAGCASAQSIQHAESLWRAHDYTGANDAFRALVNQSPRNPDYKVRWGRLFLERFNRTDAVNLFKEALEIKPDHAGAILGMALVAEAEMQPRASDLARKALEIDPKLAEARELLAKIALEDNDNVHATEEARKALDLDAKSIAAEAILASIGLLEHAASNPPLDRLAAEHPHDGRGYESIGYFLQVNRRYDDAIAYLRKAIAAQPDLWSAHSQLGLNLMRLAHEEEARKELQLSYDNHYRDEETVNSLRLIDTYKTFKTYKTSNTILKLSEKEGDELALYMQPELQRAIAAYEKKYEMRLPRPVQLEVFPNHEDFAVRTMGLPGIGILGVTFQDVVAMDSPSGRVPGEFHWASTMWHELSHVFILTITGQRVPRWFTEGVAVHEETWASPDWGDRLSPPVIEAIKGGKLLPVAQLDRGFMHPKYPQQVIVSYYQGGKICDYIAKQWGEHKLLDIAHAYSVNDSTPAVIEQQLGMKPEEFDKKFIAWVTDQTRHTVSSFDSWQKDMKAVNADLGAGKFDDVIAKAPALRDSYPEYVEAGSAYQALASAYKARKNEPAETGELAKYSQAGGRDPATLKRLAELFSASGKDAEAVHVLERLLYIAPLDEQLHTTLGALYLSHNNPGGAAREYRAMIAGKSQDQAAAHLGLARSLHALHHDDQARDELLASLEVAPNFKPAQKLLLEWNASEK